LLPKRIRRANSVTLGVPDTIEVRCQISGKRNCTSGRFTAVAGLAAFGTAWRKPLAQEITSRDEAPIVQHSICRCRAPARHGSLKAPSAARLTAAITAAALRI
jgi:hypothetical protein